jgi:hypothetical protein
MSRNLFRRWAAGVGGGELAQALAALGAAGDRFPPAKLDVEALLKGIDEKARLIQIHAATIQRLAAALATPQAALKDVPPSAQYTQAWRTVLARLRKKPLDLVRLEVIPAAERDAPQTFALDWLVRELGRAEVDASSVVVRCEAPGLAVGWEWPMRLGILAGQSSPALRKLLERRGWKHLFHVVLADRGELECDLLLLDANLPQALSQVLGLSRRVTADCTVVLGSAGADPARAAQLIATLRNEARSSGLAIVDVDPAERPRWLPKLQAEITHDMPLDVALWRAAEYSGSPKPYVEATDNLLRLARVTETGDRMAAHVDSVGYEPPARAMSKAVKEGKFEHEDREATRIAEERGKAESALGAPIRIGRRNGAPAPAPTAAPAPAAKPPAEERRVNFDLYDEAKPSTKLEPVPLAQGRRYRIDISIGYPRKVGSADGAFPAHELPPGGHTLTVVFIPLTRDDHGELEDPQSAEVYLPARGESRPCSFTFDTAARSARFDARVIVAFGNRVVQTLMFSAGIGKGPEPRLKLESVAASDLDQLAYRSRIEASIVVNHSPAGVPGVAVLAGKEVKYKELDIKAAVDEMRAALKQLAARKEPFAKLDDEDLRKQLFRLARHGRLLWRQIAPDQRALLAGSGPLQVIDARPGAYLPVEFFIEVPLPMGKKICPQAREFLDSPEPADGASLDETPHKQCPHYGDPDYFCPMRFWGFRRVIERQAVWATDEEAGDFRLSSPTPARPRIDAFRSALVAFSEKVLDPDQAAILKALKKHKVKQVVQAKDWTEWRKAVKKNSPTLLLLLPHSDRVVDDEGNKTMEEALEVGGKLHGIGDFDEPDVVGPNSLEPVVFLLGCSTKLTELPFANFVSAARQLKASLVVGTLAPVSGHRAAQFVTQMLEALAAENNGSFGSTFLKVRRRLLASGNGFALALVAYGDVDWIV